MSINQQLGDRFRCLKCREQGASVKRISTTGSGLSKLMDVQSNQFITVSCRNCGYTELYNPDFIEGKSNFGSLLDILFGG